MELIKTISGLENLAGYRTQGNLVLVPTMGALHDGHLSLVDFAGRIGPVVVSIFVNPLQFGEGEDFDRYPRDLEADLARLESKDVKAVFAPEAGELFAGPGTVTIMPGRLAEGLCGQQRPGHFAGVLTIVAKLFNLVQPAVAVFGRKDAQQVLVIDQMVRDLDMPVRIVDVPTVREPDGLAMSSRNRYLSAEQREKALCLSRALRSVRDMIEKGERRVSFIEDVLQFIMAEADDAEYAAVLELPGFVRPETISGRTLIAVAARIGETRLIDNTVLMIDGDTVGSASLMENSHEG